VIEFLASMVTQGCIFSIALLGLNVIWGWAGDLDLAFYGYLAAGAYMAMVVSIGRLPTPDQYILGWRLPFPAAALIAMASAALLALLVGAVGLRRLRAVHFAIMTLGTVLMLHIFISDYRPLFNGFNGLFGMPQPFGTLVPPQVYPYFFLAFCSAILAAVYILLERLSGSPFGRSLRAVREDEQAAAAVGRNVYALKLKAYVLGAALAGLAGALLAAFLGAFNPTAWTPDETLDLYAALFVGGRGNPRGAILGAFLVFVVFEESVRFLPTVRGNPTFWLPVREILLGLMILATLRFRIQGLLPERHPADPAPEPRVATPSIEGEHAVG
jgi:branched-chain amino acid transport system permease protein